MASKEQQERDAYIHDLPLEDKIKEHKQLSKTDLLTEQGLFLVQCFVRDGMTQEQIADVLGVNHTTLRQWKMKYPELQEAFKKGKQLVDYEVENALLKAALGYKLKSTKVIVGPLGKDGNREVRTEDTESEVGPNVTACLAWLNNRKPDTWKRNRDNDFESDDKYKGITINITKGKSEDDAIKVEAGVSTQGADTEDDEDWSEVEDG